MPFLYAFNRVSDQDGFDAVETGSSEGGDSSRILVAGDRVRDGAVETRLSSGAWVGSSIPGPPAPRGGSRWERLLEGTSSAMESRMLLARDRLSVTELTLPSSSLSLQLPAMSAGFDDWFIGSSVY